MIEFIKILPRRVRQSERFCDWCEIKFKKKIYLDSGVSK